MKLSLTWRGAAPVVTRPATCESCGQPFACELSLSGCWCSRVKLTDDARATMRATYRNCLCPDCLKRYETPA